MSPADVQRRAQVLEVARRRLEAANALLVQHVDDAAAFLGDGHRNVAAWGRGTNNWSPAEAARLTKLARAFKYLPMFAEACSEGLIGVAQMHAVAQVACNPRVRDHLAEADDLLTGAAIDQPFDDLITLLRHWETLADSDGARQRHDRAVYDRSASVRFVGERAFLDAAGPSYDGAVFEKVLAHYTQQEFDAEWDILATHYGSAMCAAFLERSDAQRRFDALQRIFGIAAGGGDSGPAVTVNITIDEATFEHELERLVGGDPDPIPPSHAPNRKCQDAQGRVLDPRAVVAAALVGQVRRKVLGADGVVLDMGRRQRLFNGPLRDAVLQSSPRCTHKGCSVAGEHCEADHLIPYARGGPTNARNGGPGCRHHNPWKNNGAITVRDSKGLWRTYRPDGTEIGWPTIRTSARHLDATRHALELALGITR